MIPLEIKKQRLEVHGDDERELYRRPQLERRSLDQRGQKLWSIPQRVGKSRSLTPPTPCTPRSPSATTAKASQARTCSNSFNRFYRSANAGENSVGIGLALAKAIFIAQGGDIAVHTSAA